MDTLEKVAAVAIDEPQIAPKAAQAPMVALASAPRMPENTAFDASNSSRAMLAREATAPIRMKSGITESEQALASANGTEPNIVSARGHPPTAAQPPSPPAARARASGTRAHT